VGTAEIEEAQGEELLATVARASARWTALEITREIADRVEGRLPHEPLRTLDAVHLASALVLRQSLPDLRLLSVDDRVRENAGLLGVRGAAGRRRTGGLSSCRRAP
jgi:predicted nucleic acid-binding protein